MRIFVSYNYYTFFILFAHSFHHFAKMSLGRRIAFTNFLYAPLKHQEYIDLLSSPFYNGPITFYTCQLETCPSTDTVHMQGYVEFKSDKSVRWLQGNFLAGGHFERANGTRAQNHSYCTKPGGLFASFFQLIFLFTFSFCRIFTLLLRPLSTPAKGPEQKEGH